MIRVSILGASGYVGGELMRLIAGHPHMEVAVAFGATAAGQPVAALHPHLALAYPDMQFAAWDAALLKGSDLIFAALPHGETQRLADDLLARASRWSTSAPTSASTARPTMSAGMASPMPGPTSSAASPMACPNFFATRSGVEARRRARLLSDRRQLPASPVDRGRRDRRPRASSSMPHRGSAAPGAAANTATHYCAVEGNMRAYGLLDHRHTAEMEMVSGAEVLFTPHLVPMSRGILATCYARATGPSDPLAILKAAMPASASSMSARRCPRPNGRAGSNAAFLTARHDPRTDMVVALAAIDNLGKGAAGQMLQCADLMLGLDEGAGLSNSGIFP